VVETGERPRKEQTGSPTGKIYHKSTKKATTKGEEGREGRWSEYGANDKDGVLPKTGPQKKAGPPAERKKRESGTQKKV